MNTGTESYQDRLVKAVSKARKGIIADARQADFPMIFAYEGYARLTGFAPEEILAKSLHILQGSDTWQPEIALMLAAKANGEDCEVTLRNYRKDGSKFWGKLKISASARYPGSTHPFLVHPERSG